jgi:hypothetical protein
VVSEVITYTQPNPNPYHKLYEEMLYPVVRITSPEGTGSGVVISYKLKVTSSELKPETSNLKPETWILTAAHVVGDYSSVMVEFCHEDTKTLSAVVVITDTNKDLALLRIHNSSLITHNYPARLVPRDYTPYLFTPVWVVGCSLGLPPRPSSGEICVICGSYWEISAPIVPGNSGGPVYAKRSGVPTNIGDAHEYEVIGIAVWVRTYHGQLITTMAGVVPIQTVYEFLESYQKLQGVTKGYTRLP